MQMRDLAYPDFEKLIVLYQDAFSGFPWFENLSEAAVRARLEKIFSFPGFRGIVLEKDGQIIGAELWDELSLERLGKERGSELADWAKNNLWNVLLWERELMVAQEHQCNGYSKLLRGQFLVEVSKLYGESLVLTRLREDNIGTIKCALHYGYSKTGVWSPASQAPLKHEYWYRKI